MQHHTNTARMYKVINGAEITSYPEKGEDGVRITDSAGQKPGQGDDTTPSNVLKNVSKTVLSLKVLGAFAGEDFLELPIDKCHVVFRPESNEYVVFVSVQNTSKKTMYISNLSKKFAKSIIRWLPRLHI